MDVVGFVASEGTRHPVVNTSEIIPVVEDEVVYVALGKDSESTLLWALHNSRGRQLCIIHVHQPAQKNPITGTIFRINQLKAHQVTAHHEQDRQDMLQLFNKYKQICQKSGVSVDVIYIGKDSIEKGIVEFVLENNVKRLVMGAAADKHYTRRMVNLRSKKAEYVRLQAAPSCQIQFVCKGNIIYTRQGRSDGTGVCVSPLSLPPNKSSDSGKNFLRSRSVSGGQNILLQSNSPSHSPGRASNEWNGISQRSRSTGSRLSTHSNGVVDDTSGMMTYAVSESEVQSEDCAMLGFKQIIQKPSPFSVIERVINEELYDQLKQAMAEAENSKREALEESIRRRKAEKDATEAKCRVKASENLYAEELEKWREIDEVLEKYQEEYENIEKDLNEVAKEHHMAYEQKSFLEIQIADIDHTVQDLEHKLFSAVDLLQNYKKERDELQIECDDTLRLLREMKKKQVNEASCSTVSQFYTEFPFSEVKDATNNFDPSRKIGEGGYGMILRGFLRHTEVAIKMLHPHSLQGPTEFQQEVNIFSKLRHPNLVTLIGACPDAWIIIYEYLSGGSLEDRLNCKDNSSPLSWQNRIRIAAELCSVLIFLHSCGIIHGDLKPADVLLDKNMVAKLSDFGIYRMLSQNDFRSNNTSLCCRTDTKGIFAYMDPEFLSTGKLTLKSDTYSFGIILLRLLTGKPALGLTKEVQRALNEETLKNILDPTAGDWPFVKAQQLVLLAMSCCDVRKNRPDLASEAWLVLEPMRASCGLSLGSFGSEQQCQIPHYFICPIFQEMMQDPVVAADGFTYEAEALRGWLDGGNNTSPMTNLKLANTNLVPNHALRSAIQEWLQQP